MTDLVSWDFETDPHNPQPLIYPVCSDCDEPYEYTRNLSFATGGYVWAWKKPPKVPRGCRHKGEAKVFDSRDSSHQDSVDDQSGGG